MSSSSSSSWNCSLCSRTFSSELLLIRHSRSRACALQCFHCRATFTEVTNRRRHERTGVCQTASSSVTPSQPSMPPTPRSPIVCSNCHRTFSTLHNLKVHEHSKSCSLTCPSCGKTFTTPTDKRRHMRRRGCDSSHLVDGRSLRRKALRLQKVGAGLSDDDESLSLVQVESAFQGRLVSYFAPNLYDAEETETFFICVIELIKRRLIEYLEKWTSLKVNFVLELTYDKPTSSSPSLVNRAFHTPSVPVYRETDLDELLDDAFDRMLSSITTYEGYGSGFTLFRIDGLLININKYQPLKGGCHIPLPSFIARRHACDSGVYEGSDCFRHAILSGGGTDFDFSMVAFPTPINDIRKFERVNRVSINVFAIDSNDKIYPLKVVDKELEIHRDLLLLETSEHPGHYVLIQDFERLVASQVGASYHSWTICKRCFTRFDARYSSSEQIDDHRRLCNTTGSPTRIVMPTEENKLVSFRNVHKGVRLPFVIYVDTECILEPIQSCEPSLDSSFTTRYQKHTMSSFGIYVEGEYPDEPAFAGPYVFRGTRAANELICVLENIAVKINALYRKNNNPPRSREDLETFASAINCHLCRKPLDGDAVFDHCHLSGRFRGAAHSKCNLMARRPNFVPVILHGGSHYDFKMIIRALNTADGGRVTIIPHTEENFISFSLSVHDDLNPTAPSIWLRFIDSIRFLPSSLDTLVKNMSREQFTVLPTLYQGEQLDLMLRKQVFPYDAISSWDSYERTSLPTQAEFYNQLHDTNISDQDYQHAQTVWTAFNIQTLGEYSDLYLRMDTLLLREVFENFRHEFLRSEYCLDPAHYYSLPGLSWDGALRLTGVELELVTDYDMFQMIESGIRGGFVQAVSRHAESDDSWQLAYVDSNNLYGYSSSLFLPSGGLAFVDDPESVDLLSVSDSSPVGYFAEVDVDVPEHLHDYFNEYPLLPEKMTPPGSTYVKLVGTLTPKRKYVLHYRTLQFACSQGMVIRKIHRVIRFNQSPWLSPFIAFNTEKRKLAITQFLKDLWKLLNNANFGKTIESVRDRRNIKLTISEDFLTRLISKPSFLRRTILGHNVAAVHMAKEEIVLDKPIFIGFSILELAKLYMGEFHYKVMRPHYGIERLRLVYTDTDSFVYNILTNGEDWRLEAFAQLRDSFDFSDLPITHPCHSMENKKVLGKFKDELNGRRLLEFVALRAKMYAMRIEGAVEIKKAKGTKKSAVRNQLTFADYKRLVFSGRDVLYASFKSIRSFRHELFSVSVNKKSLSPLDDKRHILSDKITTLAYGHRDIPDPMELDVDIET